MPLQRAFTGDHAKHDADDSTVLKDDLSLALAVVTPTMNVDGVVFIRVKVNNDA